MMDRETLGKGVHDEMHQWRKEQAERLGKRPEQVLIALADNVTELEKRIGMAIRKEVATDFLTWLGEEYEVYLFPKIATVVQEYLESRTEERKPE